MKNKLFVITGPSGVGKTSVAYALLKQMPEMERLVTFTTRNPRPNEADGVDYHFITKEEFEKRLAQNDFIEHAAVYNDFYGNSRSELQKIWARDKTAMAVLDIQGAMTMKKQFTDNAVLIFIKPDSLEHLKERIRQRPMTDEMFEKRWQTVNKEMAQAEQCDYSIVNQEGELEDAVVETRRIIQLENAEREHPLDGRKKMV